MPFFSAKKCQFKFVYGGLVLGTCQFSQQLLLPQKNNACFKKWLESIGKYSKSVTHLGCSDKWLEPWTKPYLLNQACPFKDFSSFVTLSQKNG